MKSFFRNALESAYISFSKPELTEDEVLGNVKFFFPLPLCFVFSGIAAHLILDFHILNEFFTESPVLVKVIFALLFSTLAYPFFFKFIYPLLVVENIDKGDKDKYIALAVYWIGCFVLWIFLGYITNYTRADEFNWAG